MPTTGETYARGVAIIAFEGTGADRLDVIFPKAPRRQMGIEALPAFFPDQRARKVIRVNFYSLPAITSDKDISDYRHSRIATR